MKLNFWFKHDSDAFQDEKVVRMVMKYGLEGYGIYWAVVEAMFSAKRQQLSREDIPTLAYRLHIEEAKLSEFITDACDTFKLFDNNSEYFFSARLKKGAKSLSKIRQVRKKYGTYGAKKRWQTDSKPIAEERRGEEKRGEEMRGDSLGAEAPKARTSRANKPETREEVEAYFSQELRMASEADPFYDHFESNGWKVSGKAPMKDWKAAARNWARNAEKRFGAKKDPDKAKREKRAEEYSYVCPDCLMLGTTTILPANEVCTKSHTRVYS